MDLLWPILAVLVLVAANALFVIAEYALVTVRRSAIAQRAEEGNRAARTTLALMNDPVRFISTVQIGITAVGVALGAVGESAFSPLFGPVLGTALAVVASLAFVTFLSVWLGELVPKALALHAPERIAIAVAPPIAVLNRVFAPGVWLLQRAARLVLRPLGVPEVSAGERPLSREELRSVLTEAEEHGTLRGEEEDMLGGVIDLRSRQVVDVMVPWDDVSTIGVNANAREALGQILATGFSRFPVLDAAGTVLGVLHLRDLVVGLDRDPFVDVANLVRPVPIVPPDSSLDQLMRAMRAEGRHLAVVSNEYGQMLGVATLEDVLEEVVGEIEDEFDSGRRRSRRLDDGTYEIDAGMSLVDFSRRTGLTLESDHAHTVGGAVFDALGRGPRPGDEVTLDGLHVRVETVDGARIERVRVAGAEGG